MTNLMVAYVLIFDTFYHYMNFKWLVLLFPFEVHQRYGCFWNQGIKLHHIAECHFFRLRHPIKAPPQRASLPYVS